MNSHREITPLFSETAIRERVAAIGRSISETYAGHLQDNPVELVIVLKGACIFAADLVRQLSIPVRLNFITASSYGSKTVSSGNVTIKHELMLTGRDVIIVEDIVDTGITMKKLQETFSAQGTASLRVCSLLDKPAKRIHPIHIDWIGFSVPNRFTVGYGTDYDQRYRELPWIGTLES